MKQSGMGLSYHVLYIEVLASFTHILSTIVHCYISFSPLLLQRGLIYYLAIIWVRIFYHFPLLCCFWLPNLLGLLSLCSLSLSLFLLCCLSLPLLLFHLLPLSLLLLLLYMLLFSFLSLPPLPLLSYLPGCQVSLLDSKNLCIRVRDWGLAFVRHSYFYKKEKEKRIFWWKRRFLLKV